MGHAMKMTMNIAKLGKACVLCAASVIPAALVGANTIMSPSGNVSAEVSLDGGGHLAHSVA